MSLYRDDGVVLRTWRLGEADRIIVLLTAEHGKVRAVAKGWPREAQEEPRMRLRETKENSNIA